MSSMFVGFFLTNIRTYELTSRIPHLPIQGSSSQAMTSTVTCTNSS